MTINLFDINNVSYNYVETPTISTIIAVNSIVNSNVVASPMSITSFIDLMPVINTNTIGTSLISYHIGLSSLVNSNVVESVVIANPINLSSVNNPNIIGGVSLNYQIVLFEIDNEDLSNVVNEPSVSEPINLSSITNVNNISTNILSKGYPISSIINNNVIGLLGITQVASGIGLGSIVNTNTVLFDFNYYNIINLSSIVNVNNIAGVGLQQGNIILGSITNFNNIPHLGINVNKSNSILGTVGRKESDSYVYKSQYIYSDFSFSFNIHPLTGDLGKLYDEDSINQSLETIIFTNKFERPFEDYDISGSIRKYLFELATDGLIKNEIKNQLFEAIINHEPRILIIDVIVETVDKHSIEVSIYYKIKKTDKVIKFTRILTST